MKKVGLILASGSGSRVPESTERFPKQFRPLVTDDPMYRMTQERLDKVRGEHGREKNEIDPRFDTGS